MLSRNSSRRMSPCISMLHTATGLDGPETWSLVRPHRYGCIPRANEKPICIAAKLFKQVLDGAGPNAKIRGFATNVSNYNGYNPTTPDVIYGAGPDNPNWSELRYAKALTPYLEAEGLPAHFIIDQGRSGAQGIRLEGGHWCNIRDAG